MENGELIYKCYKCDDVKPCIFRTDDIGQEPTHCPVSGKAEWELQSGSPLTFKNVSSNILHDNQGNQKLLDLVLPITPENLEAVHQAYRETGKLTVEIYIDKQD